MKKEKKRKELLELISLLSDNNNATIYLIDISDLNSNQVSILRKNFHEYNVKMKVVKNTLLRKALGKICNKKFNTFFPILNGNTSILFSTLGSTPSRVIKDFHYKEKIEKPYLKGAYVEDCFYFGNKDLDLLLNIKSKKDLIIDILNILRNPIENILFYLKLGEHKIHNILGILSLGKNKKKK
ncbi:MAG: 50S ribosomal protein L10 [Flavobacteriales bacterium]|jgi:large subunit ribosomal protein L10|uniref:50S ribosomal protein L10 n=1 Tax=Blattabacterium sp. (Mastotermes darwiniensis) TaxID=39768 RepID=UPI000231DEAB|nr:50S ribosomal protein L10 [Blattabacterium sp. (Mastotermes darwiniensis)]AER40735.1 putative 50S ribosomal protein L10 [Blattabacterium sp. (Mastotermes darwiniensis) str. MADAR]MDR1805118.1 50S ribosomal protein L10 [Flavobacteriales bacterium]